VRAGKIKAGAEIRTPDLLITNAWKGITQANHVQKAPMKSAFAVSRLGAVCTGLG
jgi:hypothetical protein